jgi:amino acid permease
MVKVQVGLGVLSIPATLHTLGIVPGVILMLVICAMNSWSDWVVGDFKRRHPEVCEYMRMLDLLSFH